MRKEGDDFWLEENRSYNTHKNEIYQGIGIFVRVLLLKSVHLIDPDDPIIRNEPTNPHKC